MKYFVSKISDNISETPEGYLVCLGVPIARTGIMEYGPGETPLEVGKNGKVLISRDEKEVFRPETMASFEGKPVTITHPKDFVNPDNWKDLAKGTLQNVRRGEDEEKNDLIADLVITDKIAIQLVKNGLREVSCGYEAEYEQTGEGKGSQLNIIGNHLALVEQGRAGSSYAINDHKGDLKMKLKEKIKSIFAKAQDDAMKAAEDEGGPDITEKDLKVEALGKGYDELIKKVGDIHDALMEGKKEKPKDKKPKDAKGEVAGASGEVIEDEDEGLESRLASLEAGHKKMEEMLSKILEHVGDEMGEATDDDEEEIVGDEGEEEESEDDDFEESGMTGDSISRAEILAPGIRKGKDIKVKALKEFYATKDGKKIIESFTGGKVPTFKSAKVVDTLFIQASEMVKLSRKDKMKQTKVSDYQPTYKDGPMTAEKMNELNAKFYNQK